jgi:hypothetical protein
VELIKLLMYNDFMEKAVSCRSSNGQFLPGFSGNPGGRPKDELKVAELARSYTVEAVETLVDLMRHSKDDRVRGTASQALLDRGWGKAKVEVATSGGQSYIEALQAVAEVIKLRSDNVA